MFSVAGALEVFLGFPGSTLLLESEADVEQGHRVRCPIPVTAPHRSGQWPGPDPSPDPSPDPCSGCVRAGVGVGLLPVLCVQLSKVARACFGIRCSCPNPRALATCRRGEKGSEVPQGPGTLTPPPAEPGTLPSEKSLMLLMLLRLPPTTPGSPGFPGINQVDLHRMNPKSGGHSGPASWP